MKSLIYTLSIFLIIACGSKKNLKIQLEGHTMGTTYHITYLGSANNYQSGIDSVLEVVNASMSTYIPTSTISTINTSEATSFMVLKDNHFMKVYESARQLSKISDGAFDYTVMPIVNHYGFGPEAALKSDLDQWETYVGYEKVDFEVLNDQEVKVLKEHPKVQMDFSAIAKGYGVDVVAEYLESKDVLNYLVEIGGEIRCKGKNPQSKLWAIGIDQPVEGGSQGFQKVVHVNNESVATSGNYRNFKLINGEKVAHTIDPRLGKPSYSNVLSATVFHPSCMIADAYATTIMVLGFDEAKELVQKQNIDVYLIYSDGNDVKTYTNREVLKEK